MTAALALATPWLAGCRDDAPAKDATPNPAPAEPARADSQPLATDDGRADAYRRIRDRWQADPEATAAAIDEVGPTLRGIANEADDRFLRANAAMLLGSLHESRGELPLAIGFYEHASKLVSDDAGPTMAFALALGKAGRWGEAAAEQAKVVALAPDDLEQWLVLGQMRSQAGDSDGAAQAYVDYERRRKGLIDGLTLKKDDAYIVPPNERVGCAEALAGASDVGTANALIYALKTDPEASVRQSVARAMGVQRISGYVPAIEAALSSEKDPQTREALQWARQEIARDPVELRDTPPPTPAKP